jgi:hypothetical protein
MAKEIRKTTGGHRIEDHFGDVTEMIETKQRKQLSKAAAPFEWIRFKP